jgi:hypothetical protein
MSLNDLQARLLWDAASKGGSQADIQRRYSEALNYLMGDYMVGQAKMTGGNVLGLNPVNARGIHTPSAPFEPYTERYFASVGDKLAGINRNPPARNGMSMGMGETSSGAPRNMMGYK